MFGPAQGIFLALVQAAPDVREAEIDPASIIVTGSRDPAAPVAGSSRVEEREIRSLQPATLLDILDRQPGVRAFSVGGAGGGSFLSVRGGEPNFTLVSIEGLKLNNPTNSRGGAFDFALVEPALVDRVEIARGAGSPIHGPDALSGVIAIRLAAAEPGTLSVRGRGTAGSRGELGLGFSGAGGWSDGSVLAAANWYDSGDLDRESDFDRSQQMVRLRQWIGGFELGGLAIRSRARRETFPEDSGGPRLAVNRERERGELSLAAGILILRRDPAAELRPNLSLSWSEQVEDTDSPAIAPGVFAGVPATTNRGWFRRVEAVADLALTDGPLTAIVGGAFLREEGSSRGTIDFGFRLPTSFAFHRSTASAFFEGTLRPGASASLNVAGRVDAVEDGPSFWTGRASGRLALGESGAALFASAGTGYKLPSFFAIAHPLVGNPGLGPERSVSFDAGLDWSDLGRAGFRLALYRNRFRNLVDFDAAAFRFVNRARVVATGVEAELRWRVDESIELFASASWLDLESETPLRGRPRWDGALRIAWTPRPGLDLGAALRMNSAMFDASIPTGLLRVQGHAEADLWIGYRFTSSLRLDVAARNLAGSRHEDAVGFPAAGRRALASLSFVY